MAGDYSKIQELLGDESDLLLNHVSKTIPKKDLQLPGPILSIAYGKFGPQPACSAKPADPVRPRAAGRNGLCFDPAGRSGNRAFGGASFAAEPEVFRP